MSSPSALTADEREKRFMQYILCLNKGQVAEVRLGRLNRVANFRHALRQLIEEFVECRAEELACSMVQEFAPPRPEQASIGGKLPKKRRMPPWAKRVVPVGGVSEEARLRYLAKR